MFFKSLFFNRIMPKSKGKVFYAVGIGHKTGVYDTWSDCKKQVEGVANPKFKKFDTLEAAQNFVSQWQSKSPNVCKSPISSKQYFGSQHVRLRDTDQGEQHNLDQKGDTYLKTKSKKKKNKNKKYDQNLYNHGTKRIYYTWNENGRGPRKYSNDRNFFYEKNKKNRLTSKAGKEEDTSINVLPCGASGNFRKGNADMSTKEDPNYSTNQQGVHPCQPLVLSNQNGTNSVRNSQAGLPKYHTQQDSLPFDTNYSSYKQYSTTRRMDYSANCVQGTCTPDDSIRYTDIVNLDILDIASISLPQERQSPSPMLVNDISVKSVTNNSAVKESNSANAQSTVHDGTEEDLTVISTPCKKSESIDEAMQEIQILSGSDEADKSDLESVIMGSFVTNEGDQTNKTSCGGTSIDDTKTDEGHDINDVLKKQIMSIINEFKNKLSLSIVTDTLKKIIDILRIVLTEMSSNGAWLVGGDIHQSKVNDFSQIKVRQSRECRKSNSFSGDLEPIVANNSSPNIDMGEPEEGGDVIAFDNLRHSLQLSEEKCDIAFCQLSEFLSSLANVRKELVRVRKMLPRNVLLQNEIGSKKMEGKVLAPNFSRSFVMSCDAGGSDKASNIEKEDSQRLPTVKTESTNSGGNNISRPTPTKRKRTWDEFSSSSEEPILDEKIKEEHDDYVPFTTDEDDYVVVFTDGSCVNNGTLNAKAGIGIYFDDGHPLNVSRPLTGVEPTNNNAEIQAARIACELALSAGIKKLKICTDSEFLINCITKWVHRWKSNGWMTGANKPVKNRVELEKLLEVISRLSVRWEKVEAHTNIKGNEMADRLANEGAGGYVK